MKNEVSYDPVAEGNMASDTAGEAIVGIWDCGTPAEEVGYVVCVMERMCYDYADAGSCGASRSGDMADGVDSCSSIGRFAACDPVDSENEDSAHNRTVILGDIDDYIEVVVGSRSSCL